MKKILEYIPLFTICVLFFGYTNLHSYYREFKIDIYNYISNTEILLSFLPTIVVWATLIYSLFYQIIFQEAAKSTKELEVEEKNEKITEEEEKPTPKLSRFRKILKSIIKSFYFYFFLWIVLSTIIKQILLKYYFPYELQVYNLFSSLVIIFIFYLAIISKRNEYDYITEKPIFVSIFIIMFINTQITAFRLDDSKKVKAGITDRYLSFKYDNKVIRTYSKLVYIGQTQSSLFLYNRSTNSTSVYKTSEMDSLIIK